ncbi:MAG: hypothetical protein PHX21_03870 [bacterium]|nr:hypothetical protein [bacterium]
MINRTRPISIRNKLILGIFIFMPLVCFSAGEGNIISLETKLYSPHQSSNSVVYKTFVMQKGNKIRIEETLPNSEEIGLVMISDGKECWYIPASGKMQKMPLIKDALEAIGIKREKGKTQIKLENKTEKISLNKEVISYKNYIETDDFGWIPKTTEKYDSTNTLQSTTEVKDVKEEMDISDNMFNYKNVKFSYKVQEMAKKLHFE